MPTMSDPSFARTLTYICEHNARGALGVIVNRPTDMNLATLFERVNIPFDVARRHPGLGNAPVYYGGPVQNERGLCCTVRWGSGNPRSPSRTASV